MSKLILAVAAVALILTVGLVGVSAQTGTTAVNGVVSDPQGKAAVGANVTLKAAETGAARSTTTDESGYYQFLSLGPGKYQITVEQPGFHTTVRENVELLVGTTQKVDFKLELGEVTTRIEVSSEAPPLNTEDASVGNAFDEKTVKALPFLARNAINLLTLQPGVLFTGESDTDQLSQGSIQNLDQREGAVNGVRGNQSNITVDGVDSNDWQNQAAFTSALPVTLDSIQEFRVTTTNGGAADGTAGGAQVALVTKSGTNQFHGNLRWYYRTTGTTANDFFNNAADPQIPRPKLQRNIGGGSLGGPIWRDRLFFFTDIEFRRDASQLPGGPQQVATDSFRDGALIYVCGTPAQCPGGSVQGISASHTVPAGSFGLGPAQIKQLDPSGIGINPAMLAYFKLFPTGNDVNDGLDGGLNFTGFRFNSPIQLSSNIYTSRVDYHLTKDGRHSLSWRGTLAGIKNDLIPAQFPGESAASQLLNNSRGFAIAYNGTFTPTLVNTFHYGYTRLGVANSGSTGPRFNSRDFTDILNYNARGSNRQVPVHQFSDDVSWTRGKHTVQFGGTLRYIRNTRLDDSLTFPGFFINDGFCINLCQDAASSLAADGFPKTTSNTSRFSRSFMALLGSITELDTTVFADPVKQQFLPPGTPNRKTFAENDYEVYVQDSWRLKSNLTVTAGVHYLYATPPWETHGIQVVPTISIDDWFRQRELNMNAGIPSDASPLLSWGLGGRANGKPSWYKPNRKDFAPRLSVAWSPGYKDGLLGAIFGGPGKSSIRMGAGIFHDRVGQALAVDSDLNGSPGSSTFLTDGSQTFCLGSTTATCGGVAGTAPAPRFSGTCSSTGCTGLPAESLFVNLPTSAALPFTPNADLSGFGFAIDDRLKTPYSINLSFSYQRELPKGFVIDAGYVGTFGRRLLGKTDFAQYLNIKDPKSGQTLFQAFDQIVKLAGKDPLNPVIDPGNVSKNLSQLAQIPNIAFFTDLMPNMPARAASKFCKPTDVACNAGYNALTPTQAFYAYMLRINGIAPSWSCGLFALDAGGISPWNTTVDPQQDGLVLFAPQWQSLPGWTNFANSNYHSFQLGVRKTTGMLTLGTNYVLSHSIDNTSGAENGDLIPGTNGQLNGLIQNPYDLRAGRGDSSFDVRHNFNTFWVLDLPFGRGKHYLSGANRMLDAVVGGWEVNGIWRWRSGLPLSPSNGFNFPTNFFLTTPGTLNTQVQTSVNKCATVGGATGCSPNLFKDPDTVINDVSFTAPGLSGSRAVWRLPSFNDVDMGVYKSFKMPWSESQRIQFRVTAFNVLNHLNLSSVNVDANLTHTNTFGQITTTAGATGLSARQMEFAVRFEF